MTMVDVTKLVESVQARMSKGESLRDSLRAEIITQV